MDALRWQLLDGIFDAALELAPEARRKFMCERCRGDAELQREIEDLLEAHGQAVDFIETPAMKIAARAAANESQIGRQVGPYNIISLLGSGGMGEVYLAEDIRLARKVALKFLPPAFCTDRERVRRFAKEARAASALNHPNIITIYDIGETEGAPFIAAEYVEGETLRGRLQAGRVPLKEALPIVGQIAAALAAAHQAGIAHRDIKPENIMLRPDGYVKVLDFGLAKLLEPSRTGNDAVSLMAETQPGLVLGTVNYMSPEQALGEKIDARTDIWSIGVVFYEMLTGQHPFKGTTQDSTFDALINYAPSPLANLVTDLPAGCEEIINRALEKERDLRFQTASDLGAELKRFVREMSPTKPVASTVKRFSPARRSSLGFGLAVLGVASLALSGWFLLSRSTKAKQTAGPDWSQAKSTQLTNQAGEEFSVSLAPDGKYFIYSSRTSGNWDIYAQRAGGRIKNNLTQDSPAADTQPVYSPDGNYIAFRSERKPAGIFVMEASSENVRRVSDIGYNPAWSPDGKELVVSTDFFNTPVTRSLIPSELWIINVATGQKRRLSKGDAVQPSWSPNGARIAYWALQQGGQRDIWTMPAGGGVAALVTNDAALDWNPVWSPDGKFLYFTSNRGGSMNFWRVAIDQNTGLTTSPPEAVVTPSAYSQHLSFSRDGKHLAYVQKSGSANLYRAAFDPSNEKASAPQAVTEGAKFLTEPDLSPDEKWLAYSTQGEKQEDIWLIKPDGAEQRQLTNDAANDRSPRWSPDGKSIAFYSDRSGRFEIWLISADGTGLRQLTTTSGPSSVYPIWSPDGVRMLYKQRDTQPFVFAVDKPWAEQTPAKLPALDGLKEGFWVSSWSADGNKLAGSWADKEGRQNFLHTYDFASNNYENLGIIGKRPVWLNDERLLLYQKDGNLWLADAQTKKVTQVLHVAPDTIGAVCPTRDNRTLYYSLQKTEADIWLWTLD